MFATISRLFNIYNTGNFNAIDLDRAVLLYTTQTGHFGFILRHVHNSMLTFNQINKNSICGLSISEKKVGTGKPLS